ncbi:DNA-processing protein DprA [Mesomycoplasma neurolyticum]|uniref:DNA processing protein smf n=1 Tax=Mesomycoplasma neurolyticum TaxID=2120 RepID=A0A449A4R1_9BACT|nr:DNA-processing protein DprA [Mesomycoplasma neurolyticum]VEU59216.1 DNA processing protein smf [Mesomycoplasma neurolyticum]
MNSILIYFSIKYNGDFFSIFNALKRQEKIDKNLIIEIENDIQNKKIQAITILDKEYPKEFKYLDKPPFVIFYKGNIKLLKDKNKISLTGDKNTLKVKKYLEQSLPEVNKNSVLVTSAYKNLDQNIINYFEKNNGKIIYVSVNGVSNPFFANKVNINENNLIISEYPDKTEITKIRLKNRNRIMASISNALVIYSSKIDSGIMNLVNYFLELGKEIFCFPGEWDNEEEDGNTALIKQGANLITSIKDLKNKKNDHKFSG